MSNRITEMEGVKIHESAYVDGPCEIGKGTKIWHFCHILSGTKIGENCVFGQNVNVAGDVKIGSRVKVQNNVSIYTGCTLEDEVFLGPSCVLTNVTNPRSQVNRQSLYEKTMFRRGATVGANATIVCGITVGRYAFIAAGAVVAKDVPDYALIVGTPGRRKGWMSRHGHLLKNPDENGVMICPESGFRYQLYVARGDIKENGDRVDLDNKTGENDERRWGKDMTDPRLRLKCLDLDEEAPLPEHLASGEKTYDAFKSEGES